MTAKKAASANAEPGAQDELPTPPAKIDIWVVMSSARPGPEAAFSSQAAAEAFIKAREQETGISVAWRAEGLAFGPPETPPARTTAHDRVPTPEVSRETAQPEAAQAQPRTQTEAAQSRAKVDVDVDVERK